MRSYLSKCLAHYHLTIFPTLNTGIKHLTCAEQEETVIWTLLCLIIPEDQNIDMI